MVYLEENASRIATVSNQTCLCFMAWRSFLDAQRDTVSNHVKHHSLTDSYNFHDVMEHLYDKIAHKI